MSETITMSVQLWRQKAREGTLTPDEMKLAIQAIRSERVGQGAVSTAAKEKKAVATKKKQPINSDDLLGELGL